MLPPLVQLPVVLGCSCGTDHAYIPMDPYLILPLTWVLLMSAILVPAVRETDPSKPTAHASSTLSASSRPLVQYV